jgi:hypothetical protein
VKKIFERYGAVSSVFLDEGKAYVIFESKDVAIETNF